MIEQMAKRLDRVIDKFNIPFAAKVSIKKTIQSEIIKLCGETSDTVRMIDIWTLVDSILRKNRLPNLRRKHRKTMMTLTADTDSTRYLR